MRMRICAAIVNTLTFLFYVRAQANSLAGTSDHAHASNEREDCTTSRVWLLDHRRSEPTMETKEVVSPNEVEQEKESLIQNCCNIK